MQGYTLAQLEAWSEAASKQSRIRARTAAIAARSARVKKEDWKKLMKELD